MNLRMATIFSQQHDSMFSSEKKRFIFKFKVKVKGLYGYTWQLSFPDTKSKAP